MKIQYGLIRFILLSMSFCHLAALISCNPKEEIAICEIDVCERPDQSSISLNGFQLYLTQSLDAFLLIKEEESYRVCNSDFLEGIETRKMMNVQGSIKERCEQDDYPNINLATYELLDYCPLDYQIEEIETDLINTWQVLFIQLEDSISHPPCEINDILFQFHSDQENAYNFSALIVNSIAGNFTETQKSILFDPQFAQTLMFGNELENLFENRLIDFLFSGDTLTYQLSSNLLRISNNRSNEKINLVHHPN
ncbi:MAG: hypothetical protein RIC35_02750 [Marinoscillum sp.]